MELFDLNIEQVLEHWEIKHAIREIISNALDEQKITGTKEIEIQYDNGVCLVRDYGRGIQYRHFTQNENEEKTSRTDLIGKFGVGLKDALGVFYRNGIKVEITSKYSKITLIMSHKTGFDIETLHASFEPSDRPDMVGTEFVLTGVEKSDVDGAKKMFLAFDDDAKLLEKNQYGEVYGISNSEPVIYANGVQIATESNFLFTYNITSMNAQMKKALNRERSNVGRTAYTDTVKNILKNCKSEIVLTSLVEDLGKIITDTHHDESGWSDIAAYAAKTLDKCGKHVFMTYTERESLTNEQIEILRNSGKELILVNDSVFSKISDTVETFDSVNKNYLESFHYEIVGYNELTDAEKSVFDHRKTLVDFINRHYDVDSVPIEISNTICIDIDGHNTEGVFEHFPPRIIIKRSVLSSSNKFCGVVLHEYAHYISGHSDNSRGFENTLTDMLGHLFDESLKKREYHEIEKKTESKKKHWWS